MSSTQLESAVIIAGAACLIIAVVGPQPIADFTNLALAFSFGAWAFWTHWALRFQKCSKCDWTYDWHFLSLLKSGHLFHSPTDDRMLPDLRRSVEYRLLGVFVLAGIFFSHVNGVPIGPILFAALLFAIITFGLLLFFRRFTVASERQRSFLLLVERVTGYLFVVSVVLVLVSL